MHVFCRRLNGVIDLQLYIAYTQWVKNRGREQNRIGLNGALSKYLNEYEGRQYACARVLMVTHGGDLLKCKTVTGLWWPKAPEGGGGGGTISPGGGRWC